MPPDVEQQIRAQVDADAAVAHPLAMAAYTETFTLYLHNPDALRAARLCVEIWNAQRALDEKQGTDGCYYFMRHIDRMLEASCDGLMVASPNAELFTYLFMRAAAEHKGYPAPNEYTELLDLIKRVGEGADLAELYRQEYGERQKRQPFDPDEELIEHIYAAAFKTNEERANAEQGGVTVGSVLDHASTFVNEANICVFHPELFRPALRVIIREARKLEAQRPSERDRHRRTCLSAYRQMTRKAGKFEGSQDAKER